MKRIFITLILGISSLSIATIGHTQDAGGCFMLGTDGRVVDLSQFCGGASPNTRAVPDFFQIPIKRRDGGIPVVDITFNNQYTYEMLFDTGASGVLVTPEMAESLGIEEEGSVISSTAGGTLEVPIGSVASVAAGGIELKNLKVAINDNLDLGLLGQSFYGNYDVTIRENVIEFRTR